MRSDPGTAAPRALGARVLRREDARLLTRSAAATSATSVLPGLLHAAFVRSARAHARVRGDRRRRGARAAGGVVAVILAGDLDGVALPLAREERQPGYCECDSRDPRPRQGALRRRAGRARRRREPLPRRGRRASSSQVDYEPLPPAADARGGARGRARRRSTTRCPATGSTASRPRPGDVDAAFASRRRTSSSSRSASSATRAVAARGATARSPPTTRAAGGSPPGSRARSRTSRGQASHATSGCRRTRCG